MFTVTKKELDDNIERLSESAYDTEAFLYYQNNIIAQIIIYRSFTEVGENMNWSRDSSYNKNNQHWFDYIVEHLKKKLRQQLIDDFFISCECTECCMTEHEYHRFLLYLLNTIFKNDKNIRLTIGGAIGEKMNELIFRQNLELLENKILLNNLYK